MQSSLPLMLFAAMLAIGLPHAGAAQQNDVVYVVTYIEALPSAAPQVRELLAAFTQESRRAEGNLEFQALQRIGRPNHFAILEAWSDTAARAARSRSTGVTRFEASLTPLLYSPPDQRIHRGLLTGARADPGPDAVYVLTHVDVIPTNLGQAVEALQALTEASRSEAANSSFDVLVTDRRNHMTIVEAWESADAQEAHSGSPHNRAFRATLAPLLGALYDDRLYRRL